MTSIDPLPAAPTPAAPPLSPPPSLSPPPKRTTAPTGLGALLAPLAAGAAVAAVVAAAGNPLVQDAVLERDADDGFWDRALSTLLTVGWRVTPTDPDPARFWLSGLVGSLAVVVLTVLLTTAVTWGGRHPLQVFVGTWTAVVVAVQLSVYARAAALDVGVTTYGEGRLTSVLLGNYYSTSSRSVFLGFVVGLVAAGAATAVSALRRR